MEMRLGDVHAVFCRRAHCAARGQTAAVFTRRPALRGGGTAGKTVAAAAEQQ